MRFYTELQSVEDYKVCFRSAMTSYWYVHVFCVCEKMQSMTIEQWLTLANGEVSKHIHL